MGKPIEPGCLCVLLPRRGREALVGSVVTVLGHSPFSGEWIIDSELIRKVKRSPVFVAGEKYLRRIDDGDFNPAADGEDNPYTISASNVWAPARQV